MTHALCAEEGPLPQGLMIQNTYTEMHNSSRNVAIIVKNSMAYPQTQKKKIPVVRVVAVNQVSELQVWPGMIDPLDEAHKIQTPKLTVKQRQEMLFKKLDLTGLGSWLPEVADSAQSLLAEYHNIFSLEPCELGCTHMTEHVTKVTDNALLKRTVQVDSSAIVGGSPCMPMRNVGFKHNLPQPECMARHCGTGSNEGWEPMLLHRLSPP